MSTKFPRAWAYLKPYETILRMQEAKKDPKGKIVEAPCDDEQWYRFGRNQNIDTQEIVKSRMVSLPIDVNSNSRKQPCPLIPRP